MKGLQVKQERAHKYSKEIRGRQEQIVKIHKHPIIS